MFVLEINEKKKCRTVTKKIIEDELFGGGSVVENKLPSIKIEVEPVKIKRVVRIAFKQLR